MTWPTERLTWRRSEQCSSGTCVEIAECNDHVLLRDGKNTDLPPVSFTRSEWQSFLARVKAGHFD